MRFRPLLLPVLAMLLIGSRAPAGTIVGTVRAIPPPGAGEQAAGGAYASHKWKFVERIDYDKLTDFVVYIDQPVAVPGEQPTVAITTQKDASFNPHVLPIAIGTTVRWPNEDDVFHNVYANSEAKEFNLGLYKSEKVPEIRFDKVGRIDVFCAIHAKMHCIILVLPSPFFAKADAHGRFVIKDVPAGTYKLKGWHERLPAKTIEVTVPAEGDVRVDLALGLSELPKY